MTQAQRKEEILERLHTEALRLGLSPKSFVGFALACFFDGVAHEAATTEETMAWLERHYGVSEVTDVWEDANESE